MATKRKTKGKILQKVCHFCRRLCWASNVKHKLHCQGLGLGLGLYADPNPNPGGDKANCDPACIDRRQKLPKYSQTKDEWTVAFGQLGSTEGRCRWPKLRLQKFRHVLHFDPIFKVWELKLLIICRRWISHTKEAPKLSTSRISAERLSRNHTVNMPTLSEFVGGLK